MTVNVTVGSLTITRAPLTVVASNRTMTYGAALPQFAATYPGLVAGETSTVLGGTLTFSVSPSTIDHVGTYAITPAGLTSANYQISFAPGTLTVNKAALTVTADNKSRSYGAPNPDFTGIVSGLVNGDQVTVSYDSVATPQTEVSVVLIAIVPHVSGAALDNYVLTPINGSLTITKAILTVTADDATRESLAAGVRTPYNLHHGDPDETNPLSSDQRLASILVANGVPYELWIYPGGGHVGFIQNPAFYPRIRAWYARFGLF